MVISCLGQLLSISAFHLLKNTDLLVFPFVDLRLYGFSFQRVKLLRTLRYLWFVGLEKPIKQGCYFLNFGELIV